MPQPGDIVVERLTGRRVIVITAPRLTPTAEELTVRFPDGRLEDRYVFELESPPTLLDAIMGLLSSAVAVTGRATERGPRVAQNRSFPQLVRQGSA